MSAGAARAHPSCAARAVSEAVSCPAEGRKFEKGFLVLMTVPRTRLVAIALLLIFLVPMAGAATRRRRKSHSKKAAPARPADAASGTTLAERVTSLMNGSVAGSSDVSLEVVDVDTGAVVAERNASVPLAPASNMKLF